MEIRAYLWVCIVSVDGVESFSTLALGTVPRTQQSFGIKQPGPSQRWSDIGPVSRQHLAARADSLVLRGRRLDQHGHALWYVVDRVYSHSIHNKTLALAVPDALSKLYPSQYPGSNLALLVAQDQLFSRFDRYLILAHRSDRPLPTVSNNAVFADPTLADLVRAGQALLDAPGLGQAELPAVTAPNSEVIDPTHFVWALTWEQAATRPRDRRRRTKPVVVDGSDEEPREVKSNFQQPELSESESEPDETVVDHSAARRLFQDVPARETSTETPTELGSKRRVQEIDPDADQEPAAKIRPMVPCPKVDPVCESTSQRPKVYMEFKVSAPSRPAISPGLPVEIPRSVPVSPVSDDESAHVDVGGSLFNSPCDMSCDGPSQVFP